MANAQPNTSDKLSWWQDAKFGMFIHWGLYSQTAGYWNGKPAKGAEHFMIHEKISLAEYGKIANQFNPTEFDAEEWVLLAKNAGMKYIVITTKHHEGFAMYDSKSSDYNIVKKTPYGKDPMKELADACAKHEMKLGFYYSLGRDWEDPDTPTNWPFKGGRSNLVDFPDEDSKVFNRYLERKVKPQLKELLTEYGPIAILWFDTPERISKEESAELRKIIEELQPNCIINNRIGNKLGDYDTPEQKIVTEINAQPWESCITMSKNWGYVEYDTIYKSPELLGRFLVEIVSKGGNLLLNVGPTGKGEITEDAQIRLATIGKWMEINAEGIRGTKPWEIASENLSEDESGTEETKVSEEAKKMEDAVKDHTPKDIIPEVRFVTKGDDLYAFVCSFYEKSVTIKSLGLNENNRIEAVNLLGVDNKVKWKQTKEGLKIRMQDYPIEEIPVLGFQIEY
jgi:alpha-L-fucosidase